MAIDVQVDKGTQNNNIQVSISRQNSGPKNIQVNVDKAPPKSKIQLDLNIRKTLDGNLMILDHKDIDIVVFPKKNKVIVFAKEIMGDHVYDSQDRFFKFLTKKGVIDRESIQGGNIYSSMEAAIPTSEQYNMVENVVMTIGKFIEEERPYYEYERALEDEMEQRLAEPSPEESTEFDPNRHQDKKGSMSRARVGLTAVYRM